MTSATRFIILCSARTGSTMLRTLLDEHPNILCHGEIMAAEHNPANLFPAGTAISAEELEALRQLRAKNPVRFLNDHVFNPHGAKAVGFKIKYEELVRPEFSTLLNYLVDDQEIRVIHLFRSNRLKRLLSELVAIRVHKQFNYLKNEKLPDQARIAVDPNECLKDFAQKEEWEKQFGEAFSAHPLINVVYEEMRLPGSQELERIQDFLGVPHGTMAPRTKKVNSENLQDVVENYDELAGRLTEAGFGAFLS